MLSFRYLTKTFLKELIFSFTFIYIISRCFTLFVCIIFFCTITHALFIKYLVLVSFLVLMRLVLNWYYFPSLFFSLSIFLFTSHLIFLYRIIFTLLSYFFTFILPLAKVAIRINKNGSRIAIMARCNWSDMTSRSDYFCTTSRVGDRENDWRWSWKTS